MEIDWPVEVEVYPLENMFLDNDSILMDVVNEEEIMGRHMASKREHK